MTCRRLAFAAARRTSLVFVLICIQLLIMQTPGRSQELPSARVSEPQLAARGRIVHRWSEGDAQFSYLDGDCELNYRGQNLHAERLLIVTDGPQGNVRNRVVVDRPGEREPVQTAVWTTIGVPEIDGRYRGRPSRPPFLLQYLPPDSIESVGSNASASHAVPAVDGAGSEAT
ncbi:MAG: hypothetical protein AAF802_28335, partial [Planctomycetota bacterium]